MDKFLATQNDWQVKMIEREEYQSRCGAPKAGNCMYQSCGRKRFMQSRKAIDLVTRSGKRLELIKRNIVVVSKRSTQIEKNSKR